MRENAVRFAAFECERLDSNMAIFHRRGGIPTIGYNYNVWPVHRPNARSGYRDSHRTYV